MPRRRTVRSPKNVIMEELSKVKSATWAELLERTELSKGALSNHLYELRKIGQIERLVGDDERRPTIKYTLSLQRPEVEKIRKKEKPIDLERLCSQLVAFSSQSSYQISKMKDRMQARKLMREYLTFNVESIVAYIPYFIDLAFAFSRGATETGKVKPEKQYEIFVKKLKNHYIKKILEPWIESLAFTAFQNRDISLGVDEYGVYPLYASDRGEKIDLFFFDKMAKIPRGREDDTMQDLYEDGRLTSKGWKKPPKK